MNENCQKDLSEEQPILAVEEQAYEEEYTSKDLNNILVALLWISIVINALSIIGSFTNHNADGLVSPLWQFVEIVLACTSVLGSWLILQVRKVGFYLMVGSRLAMILVCYFEAQQLLNSETVSTLGMNLSASSMMVGSLVQNLGQIIFLSALLTLRKNGKSGYDVLWR